MSLNRLIYYGAILGGWSAFVGWLLAELLFAGGEFGLYISFDRGENWQELKNNLPRVPVDDIQIHTRDNDMILATHGRSVWTASSVSGSATSGSSVSTGAAADARGSHVMRRDEAPRRSDSRAR